MFWKQERVPGSRQLWTVGYQDGWEPWQLHELIQTIVEHGILVDVRLHPWSKLRDGFGKADLQRDLGGLYIHMPEFGNPKHATGAIIMKDFDAGVVRLEQLWDESLVPVLMCACWNYHAGHRKAIVERLVAGKILERRKVHWPQGKPADPKQGVLFA